MIEWHESERELRENTETAVGNAKSGRDYIVGPEDAEADSWVAYVSFPDRDREDEEVVVAGVARGAACAACERYEIRLAVPEARAFARDALAFRERRPGSGDDAGWLRDALSVILRAQRVDLAVPGVREAIEAEVTVAMAPEMINAELFLERVPFETQERVRMADLADAHTRQQAQGRWFRA